MGGRNKVWGWLPESGLPNQENGAGVLPETKNTGRISSVKVGLNQISLAQVEMPYKHLIIQIHGPEEWAELGTQVF